MLTTFSLETWTRNFARFLNKNVTQLKKRLYYFDNKLKVVSTLRQSLNDSSFSKSDDISRVDVGREEGGLTLTWL